MYTRLNNVSNKEYENNENCTMDVGLILDESIVKKLSWSDNTIENILKQIDPKDGGNRISYTMFSKNSTIYVNFSNEASINADLFLSIFKDSKNSLNNITFSKITFKFN